MRRRDGTSLPIGWDYTPDRRPARARVVGVDPIGIGTADPEAMTSYIQRVAREEDLPAVHFARHVLASALGRGDVPGCSRDEWGRYFAAIFQMVRGSVDGVGRHASTWTAALEEVLGRNDLRQLTLLPFASVLPPQGLTRPIKHVCPACLDGWQASSTPVHEPLRWRLPVLHFCFAHEEAPVRLVSACRACGAVTGVLGTWALPGRCGGCGESLARPLAEVIADQPEVDPAGLGWQRWVSDQLGDLLAAGAALGEDEPDPLGLPRAVDLAIARTSQTASEFARQIGYSLSLVSLWQAGRRRPSLPAALRICRVAGFPLVDFLLGRFDRLDGSAAVRLIPEPVPPPPAARRIPWPLVKAALRRALESDPPPSLRAVLAPFGADRGEARRLHPDLSRAVPDRHAEWRRARIAAKRSREIALLVVAMRRLHDEGVYPGRERLQRALPPGVYLRDPHLRAAWKAELQAMGLL